MDVALIPDQQVDLHAMNGGLDAGRMAILGAAAGALGLENSAVGRLTDRMAKAAYHAALANVEELLGEVHGVVGARLNRLLQDVRELPEQAMPEEQGVVALLLKTPRRMPTQSLVSRDAVLAMIAKAMAEKPSR